MNRPRVHEPGHPCDFCGVNATTACRHRAAQTIDPEVLEAQAKRDARIDGRKVDRGQGHAFHRHKTTKGKVA